MIGWYLKRVRGAKLVVYLQDIHPDIAIALGKIRDGFLTRTLRSLMFRIYRAADHVIVLSRDMRERIIDSGVDRQRVACIPNWVDTQHIRPIKGGNAFREQHGLDSKFVVMYSGNMGLCQRLEDVISAADCLRDHRDIQFLLIGGGALEAELKERVLELGLSNVRFLAYQPKSMLAESLSAADVHLVPLDPRVASCLMPSKLYGALASGTPIVTVAPDDCELAELTRRHHIGLVARPGNPSAIAVAISALAQRNGHLHEMSARARQLAEQEYDRRHVTSRIASLFAKLFDTSPVGALEPLAIPERQIVPVAPPVEAL
jgi:glycosyltransferase involved in cell wall biosynthesis